MTKISRMTPTQRLKEIASIIEQVDRRAMIGDTVTPTLQEMTQAEISRIYLLSIGKDKIPE